MLFGRRSKKEVKSPVVNNVEAEPKNEPAQPKDNQAQPKDNQAQPKDEPKKQEAVGNGKAHIYNLIIVDESGSMTHLRESTLSGVNETINTIRMAQNEFRETQKHWLTLVLFDSGNNRPDVRTIMDCVPIDEVGEFKDYMPNGCTPLYDAMGESLTALRRRIGFDEDATAVVTVLTDGMENSSRIWTAERLREKIEYLKELGWSFSYMGSAHNVKEVTDLLSIENVVEFSHDDIGTNSTWDRDSSAKLHYYRRMNEMYNEPDCCMSRSEKIERMQEFAHTYYADRVTPERITKLEANEIFVFGSNADGHHGGGAAAFAMREFGAVWGQGEGLQGQSYAIPTMEGMKNLKDAVERFTTFAIIHPELRFLVTRVGCGIAGYSVSEIAPLFKPCVRMENVCLPDEFWRVLGLKMNR